MQDRETGLYTGGTHSVLRRLLSIQKSKLEKVRENGSCKKKKKLEEGIPPSALSAGWNDGLWICDDTIFPSNGCKARVITTAFVVLPRQKKGKNVVTKVLCAPGFLQETYVRTYIVAEVPIHTSIPYLASSSMVYHGVEEKE